MNLTKAKFLARKFANDFRIQHAGVTKSKTRNGYKVVTTFECVKAQIDNSNLLVYYNGRWRFEKKGKWHGWKKGHTRAIYFYYAKMVDVDPNDYKGLPILIKK